MTLPENMNKENRIDPRRLKALTLALTTSLKQGVRRKSVTSGIAACGELLQRDPGCIMMCILPTNCGVGVHIHHTLIEAFCHENGIAIMMVDSQEKLVKLIGKLQQKMHRGDANASKSLEDGSCILLKYPKREISKQDKTVLDFYQEMNWRHTPMAILSLPD